MGDVKSAPLENRQGVLPTPAGVVCQGREDAHLFLVKNGVEVPCAIDTTLESGDKNKEFGGRPWALPAGSVSRSQPGYSLAALAPPVWCPVDGALGKVPKETCLDSFSSHFLF